MMNIIKDFTPKGFRRMPGYGKTEHFDPKGTGKWNAYKPHRYADRIVKGWLLYTAVVLLLVAMGYRSYVEKELCFGAAVPLLFGTYLIRRGDDWAFSQPIQLIANIFILYGWKNVLFPMMELMNAASIRSLKGGVVWGGLAVTAILIVAGMYDHKHEMQSGFVSAVDLVAMAVLWFVSLKGTQDLSLLYLLCMALVGFAALNLLFTLPAVLIKRPSDRGNILRYFLCLIAGAVPAAAAYYLKDTSALILGLVSWVWLFAAAALTVLPGSIPRYNRRAVLTVSGVMLAVNAFCTFLQSRMSTLSAKGLVKFIGRFYDGKLEIPASLIETGTRVSEVLRAPLSAVLKGINHLVSLPEWMLSASGSAESFQMYAVNHLAVYLILAVLVSLGIELSVRLRMGKNAE